MNRKKSRLALILLTIMVAFVCTPISAYAWTEAPDVLYYVNSRFNEADLPGNYEGKASLNIYNNDKTVKWDMMNNNSYDSLKAISSYGYPDYATIKANIVTADNGFDIDLTMSSKEKVVFHIPLHAQYVRSHQDGDGNHRLYELFYNGAKLDKAFQGFSNTEEAMNSISGEGTNLLDWFENEGEFVVKTYSYVELLDQGKLYVFVLNDLKKVSAVSNDDLGILSNIPGLSKLPDDIAKLPPWIILVGGVAVALIVLRILAKILKALTGATKSKSDENNNDNNKKDKKQKKYLLQISKPELEITAGNKGNIGITAWYVDDEGSQGIATNAEIKIFIDSVPIDVTPVPASGYGKITCSFSIPQDAKEGSYSVAVIAEADGNSVTANFVLIIHEARNPAVDVDNDFVYLRCKSGDRAVIKAWVENPGDVDWRFQYQFIEDGGKQNASIKIERKVDDEDEYKNTVNIFITDVGLEPIEGEYDVRGAILVTATDGKRIAEGRRVNITICQEGIYVMSGQDADGKIIIRGDLSKNDTGWKKELDIAVMVWDETKKELVSDSTAAANIRFSSFTGENENTTAVLTALPMKSEFIKPRPGNIAKGVYAFYFDHVIPGMQDDELHGKMKASVIIQKGEISSEIKFAIKTTKRGEGLADWKRELDQCTKYIENFIPDPYKSQKLKELDIRKDVMGREDFKEFRTMCWEVAYYALMKDKKTYDNVTFWAEAQVTTLEWIQWIGDRAFALAVGTLTGTYLAFIAAQLKDVLVLFIQKYQESNKEGWDFFWDDIVQDRMTNLLGTTLDGTFMDMPDVKVSSETAIGWISLFFVYKVTWHWLYDTDDGGNRKGLICAVKASMLDLTATAIEKGLGDFVKQSLGKIKENKNGRFSSEFIGKLEAALNKGDKVDRKIGDALDKTNIAKTFSDAKEGMKKIYDKTAGAEIDHVLNPMMDLGYKMGKSVINTLKSLG